MRQYTKEEIERYGMELRRLTKTPAFEASVELIRQDYHNRWLSSAPNQKEVREDVYRQLLALDDLLGVMNTLQFHAEQAEIQE